MDHTCFHMAYRKSEKNDDAYEKTERWNCDRCHTDKVIVKEIPEPSDKALLVKLLMSLSEKYELGGTTISVGFQEVRATFRFPEHNMPKLRDRQQLGRTRLHQRETPAHARKGWHARCC